MAYDLEVFFVCLNLLGLKIVHVIDSIGRGGAELSLSHYLPELEKLGVKSEVLYFTDVTQKVFLAGSRARLFPCRTNPPFFQGLLWLRRYLSTFDLVHTQLAFSSVFASCACLGLNKPIVRTLQSSYYSDDFLKAYPNPGRIKVRLKRWAEKVSARKNCFLVAVSKSTQVAFSDYTNIPSNRFCIISNAISPFFFPKTHEDFSRTFPALVMVGRLVPEKGHATVIRSLALLPEKQRPELHLYGEGSFQDDFALLAKSLGVKVRFFGFCSNLADLYMEPKIFVHASHMEGQPLAVLEALAMGLPCILSDIPPHREVAGDAGIYFPAGDAEGCSQAIQRLLSNPTFCQTIARRAPSRAECARPSAVARQLFDYYQEVLQRKVLPAR